MIAADPAHWNVATDALVRAVVFDGLGLDHPAVSTLLEVLAPIAEAELAYRKAADAAIYQIATDWDEDEPEFPQLDGPVFLLGTCVLVDAVWAAVGEDPLNDVLGVLLPMLNDAVPGLDSQVAADALIGSAAYVGTLAELTSKPDLFGNAESRRSAAASVIQRGITR